MSVLAQAGAPQGHARGTTERAPYTPPQARLGSAVASPIEYQPPPRPQAEPPTTTDQTNRSPRAPPKHPPPDATPTAPDSPGSPGTSPTQPAKTPPAVRSTSSANEHNPQNARPASRHPPAASCTPKEPTPEIQTAATPSRADHRPPTTTPASSACRHNRHPPTTSAKDQPAPPHPPRPPDNSAESPPSDLATEATTHKPRNANPHAHATCARKPPSCVYSARRPALALHWPTSPPPAPVRPPVRRRHRPQA